MEVGQSVAFKVAVVVETRGRGNLQGECLAVASCPSKQIIAEETNHIAESSVSDEGQAGIVLRPSRGPNVLIASVSLAMARMYSSTHSWM